MTAQHAVNLKEKAFFVTSIVIYHIKSKNRYRDIEQNTVNDNKVQKGKCAGSSV